MSFLGFRIGTGTSCRVSLSPAGWFPENAARSTLYSATTHDSRRHTIEKRGELHRVYNTPMAPLSILFVCIGNTCRSPMAEAIARGLGEDRVRASSAGIMPFGRIVPATVEALEALGYDPRGLASKGLDDIDLGDFDIIVSLLGPSGLSYLPFTLGAQLESWSVRDPYGEDDDVYLVVARELELRIRELLADQETRELPLV